MQKSAIKHPKDDDTPVAAGQSNFAHKFKERHVLRLHMALILMVTVSGGVYSNKLMFLAGLHTMMWRYPIAALVSYAEFIVVVSLWLRLMFYPSDSLEVDADDPFDVHQRSTAIGSRFSGGGAGDRWGGSQTTSLTGSGKSGTDLDESIWPIVLIIALVSALAAGAVLLVIQAPTILAETAFQFALGGALAKRVRRMHHRHEDWLTALVGATWKPFAVVVFVCFGFGYAAHAMSPHALNMVELLKGPEAKN